MSTLVLQTARRVDPRVVLHEQFKSQSWDPETWKSIILVVAALLILLVILHSLRYYERRVTEPKHPRDPQKLFAEVLRNLRLSPAQRTLLVRVARDLKLDPPTMMLLSPKLFDEASGSWQRQRKSEPDKRARELLLIAEILFSGDPACRDQRDQI